jgi:hypothetical protein
MKLRIRAQEVFQRQIDDEGIRKIKENLERVRAPKVTIDNVIRELNKAKPSYNVQTQQNSQTSQESQQTQMNNTTQQILQPTGHHICRVNASSLDNAIEDRVEELIDSGMDIDAAREQAEKEIVPSSLTKALSKLAVWSEPAEDHPAVLPSMTQSAEPSADTFISSKDEEDKKKKKKNKK